MQSDSIIFLILSLLVAFGRFADFALDPKQGVAAVTQKRTTGLIGLQPAPRVSFTLASLVTVRSFLNFVFGREYCSLRKISRVAALSAFLVLGVFVFSHMLSDTAWRVPADQTHGSLLSSGAMRLVALGVSLSVLIIINAAFDVVSLIIVRHLLEPCRALYLSENRDAIFLRLALLPLYAMAIYFCFLTTMNLAFSLIIVIRGVVSGYFLLGDPWTTLQTIHEVQYRILQNESVFRIIDPIGEGRAIAIGNANLLMFCITPLLPAMPLVAGVTIGMVLDLLDRASAGAVGRRILAARESSRSVFFTSTIVISLIGGLAALLLSLAGVR